MIKTVDRTPGVGTLFSVLWVGTKACQGETDKTKAKNEECLLYKCVKVEPEKNEKVLDYGNESVGNNSNRLMMILGIMALVASNLKVHVYK